MRIREILPALLVAACCVGLTLILWWRLRLQEEATLLHLVERQSVSISEEIGDEVEHQARALMNLRRHWQHPTATLQIRQSDVEAYMRGWPGLRRVELLDVAGASAWSLPRENRDFAAGAGLDAARTRAELSESVVAGPAQRFADGSNGYSLLTALAAPGPVQGYLVTLWNASDVFGPIVKRHLELGYTVRIEERGHVIYGSGGEIARRNFAIHRPVEGYGAHWVLITAATPHAYSELRSHLPTLTLIGGGLFSLLLSGTLQLFLVARRRHDELIVAEGRIRSALREKEVLLQEVYHRVKNNLQVIQSLLELQRRAVPSGVAHDFIDDTVQRVRAMTLVHEKLYNSADFAAISLPEYVRDLGQRLIAAMGQSGKSIRLLVDVDPIEARLDVAVPLGLLLTELISNSVKHAFPNASEGHIRVSLKRAGAVSVLTAADDGIGLPPDFDPCRVPSLGLKLASSLSKQLGGRLKVVPGSGAQFCLEIPDL